MKGKNTKYNEMDQTFKHLKQLSDPNFEQSKIKRLASIKK